MDFSFRYFAGRRDEIWGSSGLWGFADSCSLCGEAGDCGPLCPHWITCRRFPTPEDREGEFGCLSCLSSGEFLVEHDTELGQLKGNGFRRCLNPELAFSMERIAKGEELRFEYHEPEGFRADAIDILRRTPAFNTHQGCNWLVHCNDFMVFLGNWKPIDFHRHPGDVSGRELFRTIFPGIYDGWKEGWDAAFDSPENPPEHSYYGEAGYYVFKCLHCSTFRGYHDMS